MKVKTIVLDILKDDIKFLKYVFVFSFLLRFLFVLTLEEKWYFIDTEIYHTAAENILAGEGFGNTYFYTKEYNLAPVYPVFLAGHYIVLGKSLLAVRITEAIIGALICLITFLLGKKLINSTVGKIAAGIAALHPILIFITGLLYVTNLFTFFTVTSALFYVYAFYEKPLKNSLLGGFFLGLATLSEPYIMGFYPFLMVYTGLLLPITWRKRLLNTALTFFVVLAVLTPWTIRNYLVFDKIVPVRASVFANLATVNQKVEEKNTPPKQKTELEHDPVEEFQRHSSKGIINTIYDIVAADPKSFFTHYFTEFVHFWTLYPDRVQTQNKFSGNLAKFASMIFYGFIFITTIVGLILLLKRWKYVSIPLFMILSFNLTLAFFETHLRYRLPVEPFLLIFSAQGIYYLYYKYHESRKQIYSN